MSGYKNFAVAGGGTLGSFIIDELLKQKSAGKVGKVVALTRSVEGNDAVSAKGGEPVVVDYTSPDSLQSALKGIEVVISTVGAAGLGSQEALGEAAKAAGVKLFVPSEFGGDTLGATEGLYGAKNAQRLKLESIGLPWAVFFTGVFSDWTWYQPFIGMDVKNGKVEVGGSGDELASFVSRRDIARYVVHVLLTLPASKLAGHVFKIEGERTTINRVLEAYEARTGKKLEITRVPLEKVREAAAKGDIKSYVQLLFVDHGLIGKEEEMNVDWPEFNPETAVDAMLSS